MHPATRTRLWLLALSLFLIGSAAALMLYGLAQHGVYFYTPTQLQHARPARGTRIRLGGLVEEKSVQRTYPSASIPTLQFRLSDGAVHLPVYYTGSIPALFREGQGVVVEGVYQNMHRFDARELLAKHDETYMPAEVAAELKKNGLWQGSREKGATVPQRSTPQP
jgi:cytochrome c-type biogenesis protein CcmE